MSRIVTVKARSASNELKESFMLFFTVPSLEVLLIINWFKKQREDIADNMLYSPLNGDVVSLENVPDPVFSEKIMGDGIAIQPTSGTLCSPVNGKIVMIFPTKHAIGIRADHGEEILIHIGIDTVCLDGKGFNAFVRQGDRVKVGQKLITFDRDLIKEEGYSDMTMVLLTEKDKYSFNIEAESVKAGDRLLRLYEKTV